MDPWGVYSGAIDNSSNNSRAYQASSACGNSGSITTSNTFAAAFTATCDGSVAGRAGFNYGAITAVKDAAYPRFTFQGAVFIGDVGDGLSITSINAAGQAAGTAAFLKY